MFKNQTEAKLSYIHALTSVYVCVCVCVCLCVYVCALCVRVCVVLKGTKLQVWQTDNVREGVRWVRRKMITDLRIQIGKILGFGALKSGAAIVGK